ncbi:MAG: chromate transporter [Clostridiales bacterium]|jgi:chromate transporter|nr:chromate transporter [Clostridiales bacterium]
MKKKLALYLKLFSSTFYISAFTFGGGFVIIPLLKKKFVDELKWLHEEEMLDMTAIAQSSPGAIAVNASLIIGYRIAGVLGALATLIGTILPPLIIISIISFFYTAFRDNRIISALMKGMQSGVGAVITDVVLRMVTGIIRSRKIVSVLTMLAGFVATFFFDINVVIIILICGSIGAVSTILKERNRKGKA